MQRPMQRKWSPTGVLAPLAAVALLTAGTARAEGMQIEPGKWEFETTAVAPMMPEPQTRTQTECVTDSEIEPRRFLVNSEDCSLTDSEVDASSMRWKITCNTGGGRMDGEGAVSSTGSRIEGAMTLVMDHGGQQMTMEQHWKGRRIGDCD